MQNAAQISAQRESTLPASVKEIVARLAGVVAIFATASASRPR